MKSTILTLFCWFFLTMPFMSAQAEVSAVKETQAGRVSADDPAALILLQMEDALAAPFYELGEASFSEVIDRRLASLSIASDLFTPAPQPVPQPPKIPKAPPLPHHLRRPAPPAIHTAAQAHTAHIDERARIDRQRRVHQPPPRTPQLPPRPERQK